MRNDVPEILQASDVVVMSSHYEGLSLSSIEGMASGKPFIASDVDGLHEITTGAGILFPEGDEKILAKEIQLLINDREYYENTVKKCQERASHYSIENTAEKYINIYTSLTR
jgi:glycosyltransferase involved in cell wall biosynthesis